MLSYFFRRLVMSTPTLLFISLVVFLLLELAPGDPTANLPLTIPPEVKEQIRQSLGLGKPMPERFARWFFQMVWVEPMVGIDWMTRESWLLGWLPDTSFSEGYQRIISFSTRSPVMDLIIQRLPQTLWVVGLSYVVGVLIAVPIGAISAYKQYSFFDQIGTFIAMVGYSVPTFFTGVLLIVIFSVQLQWFPSIYDTTHEVTGWSSFLFQVRQMAMPVFVLALYNAAQISRYMRASMLDNLHQGYVRTARAKGLTERAVILRHVMRASLIPVVTVIALNVPAVFSGAIITEQVFKVNGIGHLLIGSIQNSDWPTVQTITFLFAFLIVLFNIIADVLYGLLDPRIRYD